MKYDKIQDLHIQWFQTSDVIILNDDVKLMHCIEVT